MKWNQKKRSERVAGLIYVIMAIIGAFIILYVPVSLAALGSQFEYCPCYRAANQPLNWKPGSSNLQ